MKPLKVFKFIDWVMFPRATLLIVGYTKKEILKKSAKFPKAWRKLINDYKFDSNLEVDDDDFNNIIYLPEFNIKNWYYWDSLNHEVRHAIDAVVRYDLERDTELFAYLHEGLFRLCRKEIFKASDKSRKKTKKKVKKKLSH